MNISETSWPIIIKFHLKHHWGGGLAAIGFWPDIALPFFIGASQFLQVTRTAIKAWMGSKFGKIQPGSTELALLERLKKSA